MFSVLLSSVGGLHYWQPVTDALHPLSPTGSVTVLLIEGLVPEKRSEGSGDRELKGSRGLTQNTSVIVRCPRLLLKEKGFSLIFFITPC